LSKNPPIGHYVLLVMTVSELLALGSVLLVHVPHNVRAANLSQGMAVLAFLTLAYYLFLRLAVRSQGWTGWGRRPKR
jgi:hypothetical protein